MSKKTDNHSQTTKSWGVGHKFFTALISVILVVGLMPTLNLQSAYAAEGDTESGDDAALTFDNSIDVCDVDTLSTDDAYQPLEEADVWDGTTTTQPEQDDDGTYLIGTAAELAWFRDYVNRSISNLGANAILTADIDMGNNEWTPIANSSSPQDNDKDDAYKGTFDGGGHTVTINDERPGTMSVIRWGFFGVLGGTVKDLTLDGSFTAESPLSSEIYVGGFAAESYYGAPITNCTNNITIDLSSAGKIFAGGFIGSARSGSTFVNCANTTDITASTTAVYCCEVGGIVGEAGDNKTFGPGYTCVENCYNWGNISASCEGNSSGSGAIAGGIIGHLSYPEVDSNYIYNCYSSGDIFATAAADSGVFKGAIIGEIRLNSPRYTYLNYCYWPDTSDLELCNEFSSGLIDTTGCEQYPDAETLMANLNSHCSPVGASRISYLSWLPSTETGHEGMPCFTTDSVAKYGIAVEMEDHGTVVAEVNDQEVSSAAFGDPVVLMTTPNPGYKLGSVSVQTISGDPVECNPNAEGYYTFTMPDEAVDVTITWTALPYGVTLRSDVEGSTLIATVDGQSVDEADTDATVAITGESDEYYLAAITVTTQSGNTVAYTSSNDATYTYTFTMPAEPVTVTATWLEAPEQDDNGYYLIGSEYDLKWFRNFVNQSTSNLTANAKVMEDITVSDTTWVPIANRNSGSSYAYNGTFDGQGHTITINDTTSTYSYFGFFEMLGANSLVKDLTLDGELATTATADSYIAAFTSYSFGATITGCTNKMNISATSEASSDHARLHNYAAGFVAYDYGSTIVNCGNEGDITSTSTVTYYSYVRTGGIVAYSYPSGWYDRTCVENCYNWGEISAESQATSNSYPASAGGIVGYLYYPSSGYSTYVNNCYNAGGVSATTGNNTYADKGGIVGYVQPDSSCYIYMENCYWDKELGLNLYGYNSSEGSDYFITEGSQTYSDKDELLKNLNSHGSPAGASGIGYKVWSAYEEPGIFNGSPYFAADADTIYNITLKSADHGTIVASIGNQEVGSASYGDIVTITCVPDPGYSLSGDITVTGDISGDSYEVNAGTTENTFTFEMLNEGVTIEADWIANTYGITLDNGDDPQGVLQAAADATVGIDKAATDSTVTISAVDVNNGYVLGSITVVAENGDSVSVFGDSDTFTFTMPACAVKVSASWTEIPKYNADGVYELYDYNDLEWFRDAVNSGGSNLSLDAILMNNIDCTTDVWEPIAPHGNVETTTKTNPYTGTFDGNGKTITFNTTYEGSSDDQYVSWGLFGEVGNGGVVKDLTLKGTAEVLGSNSMLYVGAFAALSFDGTFENCINRMSLTTSTSAFTENYIAGIVGYDASSTIYNCGNEADINVYSTNTSTGYAQIGGIVANQYLSVSDTNQYSTIGNCYNWGDLTLYSSSGIAGRRNVAIGGLMGEMRSAAGNTYNTLDNSYNKGDIRVLDGNGEVISESRAYTGALIGYLHASSDNSSVYFDCTNLKWDSASVDKSAVDWENDWYGYTNISNANLDTTGTSDFDSSESDYRDTLLNDLNAVAIGSAKDGTEGNENYTEWFLGGTEYLPCFTESVEPTAHEITVDPVDHASISVNKSEAIVDDTVTITVTVEDGYEITDVVVRDADGIKLEVTATGNNTYTFKMPDSDVTVEVQVSDAPEKITITTDMFEVDTTYGIYDGSTPVTKTVSSDLVEGVDYTVTYTNNTSAGEATITITGIGDYTGTLEYTFKVIHYFEDVGATVNDVNEWYFDAVYGMVDLGAITGYNETIFGVGDSMSRAQLVTIMWRYCEPEEYANYDEPNAKDTTGLPDAQDGMYYTGAVNWAYANGVITGNQQSDGTYTLNPDDPVTFDQMVTILARYCLGSFEAADTYPQTALNSGNFTDKDAVEEWAAGSMSWAIANGVVTGNDNHDGTWTLSPLENVARERATTVIYRTIEDGLLISD